MALLYKQKMTSDITPSEPDIRPQLAIQEKAQDIQNVATEIQNIEERQKLWELKKQQEQVDLQNKTYKNQIMKTYKIGQVSYGDDVEGYRKYVGEETKKIWNQVPDGEAKTRMMAEVQIEAEVFDAQVVANNNKKIATQNKNIQIENGLRMVYSGETGLRNTIGSILLPDANVSPSQQQKNTQAFKDSMMMLQNAYNGRNAKDDNGNNIFTKAEISEIEKAYENAGRNALLGFASDNLDYNRQGVVNTYDYLKNNRAEVLKKYNMDGEQYDKTLTDMKSIIDGKSTAELFKTTSDLNGRVDAIELNDDKIPSNINLQGVNALISEHDKALQNMLIDKGTWLRNTSKLKEYAIAMDRQNAGIVEGTKKGFFKKAVSSVDEIKWQAIDNALPADKTSDTDVARYDLSQLIYKDLKAKNIDIGSVDVSEKAKANTIINNAIFKYLAQTYKKESAGLDPTKEVDQIKQIQRIQKVNSEQKVVTVLDLTNDKDLADAINQNKLEINKKVEPKKEKKKFIKSVSKGERLSNEVIR